MNRLIKFSGLVLVPVAAAAGWGSAVATSQMAVKTGAATSPALAWTFPVVIEGAAISAALLAYVRAHAGEDAAQERAMMVVLALLAMVINIAHAWGSLIGVVMAACPTVILVRVVHMFLRNLESAEALRRQKAKEDAEQAAAAQAERERLERAEHERLEAERSKQERRERAAERRRERTERERSVSGTRERKQVASPERAGVPAVSAARSSEADVAAVIERLTAEGIEVTGKRLGVELGVSEQTGRRRLAEWRESQAA